MRNSFKAIVVLETLLSWAALLLAVVLAFFAYAPTPEDFSSPSIGYSMAVLFVVSGALFHFSAGHLEKHGKFSPLVHLPPLVLIGLALAIPRIAA